RSGSTPEMPGHQSDRWYGSATNDQTSSTGASRTRSAAYRGKELLAAEHPLELGPPLVLAQDVDPRVRGVAWDLLHPEVPVGDGGARRARFALAHLADEFALAHADVVQLGGDRVRERRPGGVPLRASLDGEIVHTGLCRVHRRSSGRGRIDASVERRELLARL